MSDDTTDTTTHGDTGVLLATDLGFRCDRATTRAIALARGFGGAALAATVVESSDAIAEELMKHRAPAWYRPVSPRLRAEWQLRREFDGEPVPWRIDVAEGRAGERLSQLLDEAGAGTLVVTGPVREGVLGPTVLGSTVDTLLRRPQASLLLVRERPQGDYRRLLVASDFSEPSRQALQRAHRLFPAARLTLLHGFEVPMLGLMDTTQDEAIAATARQAREQGQAFLRDSGLDGTDVELVVEHGDPARLLRQYLDSYGSALVVVGTHGRGGMYGLVVGSVARRIVNSVDADTLVVRG